MGSPTLGLRIGAVFILFVVSALGCLTPYLFIQVKKRKERSTPKHGGHTPAHGHQHAHAHGHHHHHEAAEAGQQHQLPPPTPQNAGGPQAMQDYAALKKQMRHRHIEAFTTTRAMHLLKAFSAGMWMGMVGLARLSFYGGVIGYVYCGIYVTCVPTYIYTLNTTTQQASCSPSASCTCWRRRRRSWPR